MYEPACDLTLPPSTGIWLKVLQDNADNIKTYERLGFTVEGRLKAHAVEAGTDTDEIAVRSNKSGEISKGLSYPEVIQSERRCRT